MVHFDIKRVILFIVLGIVFFASPPVIRSQNLEIHYINVQQGQSVLIIGPDGTTVLLDGGYEFKGTNEVVPYLQSLGITTAQALDYIIASHRDTDHYRGLTETMSFGYDALNVYDNGSDKYNIYVQDFLDAAAGTTAAGVNAMALGQVINLGNGATATCVAVNGSVIGVGAIPNSTLIENDRSICLLIQYGGFDYLVTGDIGGGADDFNCTARSTSQVNMETPLVQAIMPGGVSPLLDQYGVEVAHVSHHGSESSTNSDYMNALSPRVACISVGSGQSAGWEYPRIDVVENVLLALVPCVTVQAALVLQTEEGNPTGTMTSFAGYSVGDIVITTNGVNSYTVNASGAVSQGADERTVAGLPVIYSFDEIIASDSSPILFNIHAENVGDNSADIAWSTNENATSVVKYGVVSGNYPNNVDDTTQVLTHSLNLTGLDVATTYYYIVESTDVSLNTTTSIEYSFTTTGTPQPEVVFSEIFYDTPGIDSIEEWIELYNGSTAAVNVSGWTITDNNDTGATFTIPNGTTMQPGTYLTIAGDSAGFNALYGFDADVYGAIPALNNSGDALILKDSSNNVVDFVAWEGGASGGVPNGWGSTSQPNAPTGSTIVRTDPATDTDTYQDWSAAANNGNPQTQAAPITNIVFSEIFYDTPGNENDEEWVELYNNTPNTVDLGGWRIIDNNGTGFSYTFPAGETIAPGTYYTVARNSAGFVALYGYEADLYANLPYLNNSGDTLILYDNTNNEIDAVAWEGGASAGIPVGWGSTSSPWASSGNSIIRTDPAVDTDTYSDWGYATNNGNPQTQPIPFTAIVFSEIFYDTPGIENDEEWIEIYNNTANPVNLQGWRITDNNGTGFSYTFPAGETMAPGTYYTVARNSAGFVALYGYEADLYANLPYLNNGGDTLILYNPTGNAMDFVAWEGGASAGIPVGWGSTSNPWASAGNSIIRTDPTVDTDTYVDWGNATNNGDPWTQAHGIPDTTPTVTTTTISGITGTSAASGGNVSDDGGASVTARGVCWSTTANPTTADNTTSDGSGTGTFTSSLTGLAPGATYHVRAYATNSVGTSYGSDLTFTTNAILPTVTTAAVSNITTISASSGGDVIDDGGAAVTARGVCWSTTTNPTTADNTTSDGSGTGTFTSSLTGLAPGTTYHVRAYATNSIGTSYGSDLSFTTNAILPTVTTTAVSNITAISASSGGDVSDDGGASVTARGVCWGASPDPTTSGNHTTDGNGTGTFTSAITGLVPGTTYHVRAYATNSVGTSYGSDLTFTTNALAPTVTTAAVSSITVTSASSGGNVSDDGGASVTARGVCWSTSPNPDTSGNHTTNGSGTGTFISAITGLVPGTTYYVRAYARNSVGVGYGRILSFRTLDNPTISGRVSAYGVGLSGVVLSFSNNGGTARTDANGDYRQTVKNGWSGTIKPIRRGYAFSPGSRVYQNVQSEMVNQDYVALTVNIALQAQRKRERAWIVERQYGEITAQIDNPGNVAVSRYILYRRENNGAYVAVNEISGSALRNGSYLFRDMFLDNDKSYTYRMTALDASGMVLAVSKETTI